MDKVQIIESRGVSRLIFRFVHPDKSLFFGCCLKTLHFRFGVILRLVGEMPDKKRHRGVCRNDDDDDERGAQVEGGSKTPGNDDS